MASVAFCSPLPPEKTGIATYARAVLDGFDEIGFSDRHDLTTVWPINARGLARIAAADVAVYQIGNNVEFHGAMYGAAVEHPGVVVVHDLSLDGLIGFGLVRTKARLAESARREAFDAAPRQLLDTQDPLAIPTASQVARRARAVIVHSRFARDYLRRAGCRTPIFVAPHPLVESDADVADARGRRRALRAKFTGRGEIIVGVAGDLNQSKGISELLEAIALLRTQVHLVLVGRTSSSYDVKAEIARAGVGRQVSVVANASDGDFLSWLCSFDVLVNLRFPHRGETSGSLVRAMHAGVPTIVSGTGTYLEVPEGVVHHIPPGPPDPVELATAIDRLASDPDLRDRMRAGAEAYARDELAPRSTAAVYEAAIDDAIHLLTDPYRRALGRWAGALAESGVGPADVDQGFGLRYAEGLFEVRDAVR